MFPLFVLLCVFSLLEGTSGSNHRSMSSGAGGPGLEKNVLTQSSGGTYFSSCERRCPSCGSSGCFIFIPNWKKLLVFAHQRQNPWGAADVEASITLKYVCCENKQTLTFSLCKWLKWSWIIRKSDVCTFTAHSMKKYCYKTKKKSGLMLKTHNSLCKNVKLNFVVSSFISL